MILCFIDLFTHQNFERMICYSIERKQDQFQQVVNIKARRMVESVLNMNKIMTYIKRVPDEVVALFTPPDLVSNYFSLQLNS